MKSTLTLTLVVFLLSAPAALANVDGAWTASQDEKWKPDWFYVSITYGHRHQNGSTMPISTFSGLSQSQINATTSTPVEFTIDREAGKAKFEGTFRNGKGAGVFTFVGNRAYPAAIEKLGVKFDLDRHNRDDEEETLFQLALHDVSTAFIRSMQAEGYKESLEKYLTMRIFNITPEYIREMRSLGFRDIDAEELVASRIHRVTPDYIREMRAAGWNLSLDELQSSRIHGATPQFAEQMRKLGYGNLTHEKLVAFRIHRITPEFIAEMRRLGFDDLSADDLLAMSIHRVTAKFVDELKRLGYANLTADQLVAMRIHRVTPEFIRELEAAGYRDVPVDKLVAMRIHGVDAKFIKSMSKTKD